jgi:hypothetical protein
VARTWCPAEDGVLIGSRVKGCKLKWWSTFYYLKAVCSKVFFLAKIVHLFYFDSPAFFAVPVSMCKAHVSPKNVAGTWKHGPQLPVPISIKVRNQPGNIAD